MANWTKIDPVGMDWHIHKFQTYIYNTLVSDKYWQEKFNYDMYGRCYRNKTKDGYVAEMYLDSGEYKEVYWDDTKRAISFWGISGTIEQKLECKVDAHLIFFVDLDKLQLTIHRADEEVRQQVLEVVGRGLYGFTLKSIDLWTENVLRDYPGTRKDAQLAKFDTHPLHCFRLNFSLSYKANQKFSSPKLK